jgi:hypothetical protein
VNIVTPNAFPFGLRCMMCDKRIPNGEPYVSVPNGMVGEDFVSDLVCTDCADVAFTQKRD